MKEEFVDQLISNSTDRRKFLKRVGATGIVMAAATVVGGSVLSKAAYAATTVTDADIFIFALNLEYLEAEFYAVATYGANLLELGVLTAAQQSGPTTGGRMVPDFGASSYLHQKWFNEPRSCAREYLKGYLTRRLKVFETVTS